MTSSAPGPVQRVRVTGPPRRRTPPGRVLDADPDSRLGEVYLGSLMRAQLGLAARVLALLALGIGSLPLLFVLVPGLAGVRVLGVPLSWLLLGVLTYPFLYVLGGYYVRRAERNERHFADLVRGRDEDHRIGLDEVDRHR